jgi:ubiquinone/menaquinone biosynthesis C-methylase UbiE
MSIRIRLLSPNPSMPTRDFKHESLRHFNRIAGRYDSHRYGKQTSKVHQQVRQIINELRPASLLDVGCGNGGFLSLVRDGNRMLAGADLSPEMITVARQRLGETVDLRVADSEHLPWDTGTFDCLTCNYSFHHYPNPGVVLLDMRRVLKPGGYLVMSDPWFPGPLRWFANVAVRFSKLGDVRMYSLAELRALFATAGLQVQRLDSRRSTSYVVARKKST